MNSVHTDPILGSHRFTANGEYGPVRSTLNIIDHFLNQPDSSIASNIPYLRQYLVEVIRSNIEVITFDIERLSVQLNASRRYDRTTDDFQDKGYCNNVDKVDKVLVGLSAVIDVIFDVQKFLERDRNLVMVSALEHKVFVCNRIEELVQRYLTDSAGRRHLLRLKADVARIQGGEEPVALEPNT